MHCKKINYNLIIDTSSDKSLIAVLDGQEIKDFYIWNANYRQSETLLPKIERLLHKNRILLKNLNGIIVNKGPGSFTGLRVGIATANALSFALGISVLGVKVVGQNLSPREKLEKLSKVISEKKFKKLVKPFYIKPPHITKRKRSF